MGAASDVKKAYRLLRRALRSRKAVQRVRRAIATRPPMPQDHYKIAVYFADGPVNMYQMRQWYRPLAGLNEKWPVVVLARNAGGAEAIIAEGGPTVAFVPTVRDLERFIRNQDIRIVLYVNQNTRNFQMFRYGRRWHVFINHGESDKMYMTTNQYKAYDYALVAGQAARDRLSRTLWDFNLDSRTIEIGRPQADHFSGALPYTPDERVVVLYAPTWEGDRPSAHYGSIATHGEALAAALLNSASHRLIYRPHPRSGVVDDAYGAAHRRIVAAIRAANDADPTAHHFYDDGPEMGWQIAAADVAIVDISAMVYDRLATGKPLMISRPVDERASVDTGGYLSDCEWLTADAAVHIVREVERVRADEEAIKKLSIWVRHYFGDTTQGVATEKFHAAIQQLMQKWDGWHEAEIGMIASHEDDDDEEEKDDELV
ncbi:MAG TPA: hypothetical protein DIW46_12155 [Microbacterium sp.]|nr:hypothetical protein [Microbacterium sp.]